MSSLPEFGSARSMDGTNGAVGDVDSFTYLAKRITGEIPDERSVDRSNLEARPSKTVIRYSKRKKLLYVKYE